MSESTRPKPDDGLDPLDRPRALGLIIKRHGRRYVKPTAPTRIEIFRERTGEVEAWEIIAWVPRYSEFVAWRRDTRNDNRLKAKEFEADGYGVFQDVAVTFVDRWDDEPIEYEDDPGGPRDPDGADEDGFLRSLGLDLADPNRSEPAKPGSTPPEPPDARGGAAFPPGADGQSA